MNDQRFVAAWLSTPSADRLRKAGIHKTLHMTTAFDPSGTLVYMKPYPWMGVKVAGIAAIEEWPVNGDRYLVALLECDWAEEIKEHYRQQGLIIEKSHRPHITLEKDVLPGTAALYQRLIGMRLYFDRHGPELPISQALPMSRKLSL